MNYRMRRQGEDLGVFTLEDLRQRRESGELTGGEYLQGEGMSDWQPLDLVLQQGYRVVPPPLPLSVSKGGLNPVALWLMIGIAVIFFVAFSAYVGISFQRGYQSAIKSSRSRRELNQSSQEGVAAASKPVTWTTNTLTERDVKKRAREFRRRQWLEGYENRGRRNPASDAAAEQFIRVWIDRNYGGPDATNTLSLEAESDRLAQDPDCTDPLVLTVAADNNIEVFAATRLYERAIAAFPDTQHKAYPRLYASAGITRHLSDAPGRIAALDAASVKLLEDCFADGSFLPGDQQEIGEIFVNGWGNGLFERKGDAICQIAHQAGPAYQWLAFTLDGERQINEAWKARGGGYANTVTKEGWQGFNDHLAAARNDLTQAWKLQPGFPLAPCRMMTVALGDSGADEMRTWFDRAVSAQIDYPEAWSEMRWGLRPRWYGSENAMLALGRTAINTKRFDTDVPRKFFDSVADAESEMDLASGRHIYGRADIWPEFQTMYQGYISDPSQSPDRTGWRSAYAIVAYFAGKYDVAAEQLKALDWKLQPKNLTGWGADLSLLPAEVAARTGLLGKKIAAAESGYQQGDVADALRLFTDLQAATNADIRTLEFVQARLASLALEQRLQTGEWVDFMPLQNDDPGWVCARGKMQRLPDGALEVRSGPAGHYLFSRARVGSAFEIRGEFEVVHSSTKYFQAGLVMGVPDVDAYEFQAFRIKRHQQEGDIACFAQGWGRRQLQRRAKVNDVRNSFDFRLYRGHVTATVNGEEVFKNAVPKDTLDTPEQDIRAGLGAYNDSNDTVIRYRNVQIRKLTR
jgi:3-keto-disaccharide hydrolase